MEASSSGPNQAAWQYYLMEHARKGDLIEEAQQSDSEDDESIEELESTDETETLLTESTAQDDRITYVASSFFEDLEETSEGSVFDHLEVIESPKTHAEVIQEEEAGWTYTIFEYLYWGVATLFSVPYEYLKDIFYDGKHPCKQAKYACVLQEIKKQLPYSIKEHVLNERHCTSPLQEYMKKIVLLLSEPDEHFTDGKRTKHREFLKLYREALTSKAYEAELRKSHSKDLTELHEIANAVYNVQLFSFIASVICGVIQKGHGCDSPSDIMKLTLDEKREAIRNLDQEDKAPLLVLWYNCAKGSLGMWFDPHMMGNIPHILFDFYYVDRDFDDHSTRFIRTGTPTIDEMNPEHTLGFRTRMAPEFLAYLRHCRETEKKLLYFNLQVAIGNAESIRSELLIKTFKEERLEDSIFMLDHDSDYYNQSGKWKYFNDPEKFKQSIIDHLMNNPSFWVPRCYQDDSDFLDDVRVMIDNIHEDVFHNEEMLDQEERQDFLDIAYSHFILTCILYIKPDVVITCCKDALDRAGVRNFLFMYLVMLYTDKLEESDFLDLMVTTFGPPFLMKKQALIEERFNRLNRCYRRLSQDPVKSKLHLRGQKKGMQNGLKIFMHPLEEQIFNMKEGVFQTELDQKSITS